MSMLTDIRRQQRIRAAEGYLDLVLVFCDRWDLPPAHRDRLARRALDELSSLAFEEPPRGHVYYLQGQALRVMERYEDAIQPLKLAAEWDQENLNIHLALGWCYKRIGRLDLAIQSLEEAMDIMPGEGIIHYNLACYWSLARNTRLALRYLHQSFELDPNYRDMVEQEEDFDPIRNDPGFQNLTSLTA